MNLTSCIVTTSIFLKVFQAISESVVVVDTSSGAAFIPLETWSVYCSHKAARRMFHQTLAAEASLVRIS